jgi:integrase
MSKRDDGAGYIVQCDDGTYRGHVRVGGKRYYRRAPTKKSLLEKFKKLHEQHASGLPLTGTPTVAEWLDHWLVYIAPKRVRPRTLESYADLIRIHITPALGKHHLDRLQPHHIEAAWDGLTHVKKRQGKETRVPLSPSTVLRCHRVLARALVVASHRGMIAIPPTSRMDAPTAQPKEQTALTAKEARAVLAAAAEDRLAARWTVALSLGLRQGEALGLKWDDIDWDKHILTVRRKLERVKGVGLVLAEGTKGSRARLKVRRIRIPAQLLDALRDHQQRQRHERMAAGPLWHRGDFDGLVFTTEVGTPIDRHNDRRAWIRLLKKAGVSPVRLHDGRHTAATLLLEQGVPARVVMEILGHASSRITLDVYSHVTDDLSGEAAAAMERALWGEEA